jgi:hypothetical protein
VKHIVTLSTGDKVDLRALEKPLGMYPEEVREALQKHGGPYQRFDGPHWGRIPEPRFSLDSAYRLAPGPLTKPDPPWHILADWVQWVARDEDGEFWAFNEKPELGKSAWWDAYSWETLRTLKFDPGTCDWRDSLVERPEGMK